LRAPGGLLSAYLDRDRLDAMLVRHRNGFEDATDRVWRLLNLQIWGDTFITGKRNSWRDGLITAASAQ